MLTDSGFLFSPQQFRPRLSVPHAQRSEDLNKTKLNEIQNETQNEIQNEIQESRSERRFLKFNSFLDRSQIVEIQKVSRTEAVFASLDALKKMKSQFGSKALCMLKGEIKPL